MMSLPFSLHFSEPAPVNGAQEANKIIIFSTRLFVKASFLKTFLLQTLDASARASTSGSTRSKTPKLHHKVSGCCFKEWWGSQSALRPWVSWTNMASIFMIGPMQNNICFSTRSHLFEGLCDINGSSWQGKQQQKKLENNTRIHTQRLRHKHTFTALFILKQSLQQDSHAIRGSLGFQSRAHPSFNDRANKADVCMMKTWCWFQDG